MKIEIDSYEAKTKLTQLLRQVKTGKSFRITDRGKAIADLVPSLSAKVKDRVSAAEKLKAFTLSDPVRGVNVKALMDWRRTTVRHQVSLPVSVAPAGRRRTK